MQENSGEIIAAVPVTGVKTHELVVKTKQPFICGGADRKERALLSLREGKREIPMVIRGNADRYIKGWTILHDVGLPVVNTIRRVFKDNKPTDSVLIPDLKADGSELYGKGMYLQLSYFLEKEQRFRHNLDQVFISITDRKNIKKIEEEVQRLAKIATEKGVSLPDDDAFELWIHPDKSWELITLDPVNAKYRTSNARWNKIAVNAFLDDIKFLRTKLLSTYKDLVV